MANSLLTIDKITLEALRLAHEKLAFIGTINRQFDAEFGRAGGKIGDTLRIRKPSQYTRRTGSRVMDVQDSAQQYTSVTTATQDGVDMRFNSRELSLDLENFSKLHLEPAMAVLCSGVESDVLQGCTKKVYNLTGTAGTAPTDLTAFGQARAKLNGFLAPKDGNRNVQMDSMTMAGLVNGMKGLLNPGAAISEQFREGFIARLQMADFYENERIYTHSNSAGTTPVNANDTWANAATTLTVNTTTTAWAAGTVFTIAGVYACHPETKKALPFLQQFVVQTGSTATVLNISPTIYISGARQNVCDSSSAAISGSNTAACTIVGSASTSYQQSLMYHKDAFTFVTAELPLMKAAEQCVVKTMDGLSIRVWQDADIRNDELLTRIDMLYGYEAIRPEWACRITN